MVMLDQLDSRVKEVHKEIQDYQAYQVQKVTLANQVQWVYQEDQDHQVLTVDKVN